MYEFIVEGMSCGGCVSSIEKAFLRADNAAKVQVDLGSKKVRVQSQKSMEESAQVIEDAGYTVIEKRMLA